MSNLGYKFMRQGFLDEAKAEFEKGYAIKSHHKNIEEGLARLTRISEQEEEKMQEALEIVAPKAKFYNALADAISRPQLTEFPKKLIAPECPLTVTLKGDEFFAVGEYKREGNALAGIFGSMKEIKEYRIEYTGHVIHLPVPQNPATLSGSLLQAETFRTSEREAGRRRDDGRGDEPAKVPKSRTGEPLVRPRGCAPIGKGADSAGQPGVSAEPGSASTPSSG